MLPAESEIPLHYYPMGAVTPLKKPLLGQALKLLTYFFNQPTDAHG
jgi:hypothetical protein